MKRASVSAELRRASVKVRLSFRSGLRFAVKAVDERRPVSPSLMRNLFHSIRLRSADDKPFHDEACLPLGDARPPHYRFAICGRQITRKP